LQLHGKQTLIVGGGLTRGHLAVGAIAREAQVLLRTRRYFPEKLFDTEPVWLGPKYLKGFAAEPDCHSRWETIQQARNGDSMTPEIRMRIIFDRWFSRAESGPVARNLSGARMACDRIVPAIVKSSIALSPAVISYQSLVIISFPVTPE